MKSWRIRLTRLVEALPRPTRHDFAIAPVRQRGVGQEKSKLYYCIHCKWSFLVRGTKVAALSEDGTSLDRDESLRRLATFERGPCSAMELFVSAASLDSGRARPHIKGRRDVKREHPVARELPARSDRSQPVLRVVARMISGTSVYTKRGS